MADDILDFEGMLVVWKDPVVYDGTTSLPTTIAIRVNAEISWPAQVPYARRQKAFYTTELFKR